MKAQEIDDRLAALRAELKREGIDAVIIFGQDPHQSEYPPTRYEMRKWISGFTGSAGTVIVTAEMAGVWTDGRYFLQAEEELQGTGYSMMKLMGGRPVEYVQWLIDHLDEGATVLIDGAVCSLSTYRSLSSSMQSKGLKIRTNVDIVDRIWVERPEWPRRPIYPHEERYAGQSRKDKLITIREQMLSNGVEYHLVVPLDAIAWTLNLRGSDVDFNPVFIAYLIIEMNKASLYVHQGKIPMEVLESLRSDGVEVKPYEHMTDFLNSIPSEGVIGIDPAFTTVVVSECLGSATRKAIETIPMQLKAIKNDVEIGHIRQAMIKDGMAILRTKMWLDDRLASDNVVTEHELGLQLAVQRGKMPHYIGESFNPIVGYLANGAIIHYRAQPGKDKQIKAEGMLLVDSGGQYLDGTTDITRTFHLSAPSPQERKAYTLVLKGHINLARARFPRGTTGVQLDTLARIALWREGMDFRHGTGHGVGFFLNVHEPPQGFVDGINQRGTTKHEPGMVTSNEPGYYLEGAFGIRIENLVLCREDEDGFLSHEDLTLYPMERKLIDLSLLSPHEIQWLDDYHSRVLTLLGPLCTEGELNYLKHLCAPLS